MTAILMELFNGKRYQLSDSEPEKSDPEANSGTTATIQEVDETQELANDVSDIKLAEQPEVSKPKAEAKKSDDFQGLTK